MAAPSTAGFARRIAAAGALVAVLVALGACQQGSGGGGGSGGPRGAESGKVRALVTEVTADELRVVEIGSGEELVFVNGDDSVPVEHLEDHRREELPVIITWSTGPDGRKVAERIADA